MNLYVRVNDDGTVGSTLITSGALPEGYTDVSREPERDAIERRERRWDGEAWVQWVPPQPPDYGPVVGVRDFLRLFTPQQRVALRQAARTDPAIEDWAQLAQVPEPIRLGHPDTIAGLNFLVSKNLLTPAERDRILRGERPSA